MIPPKPAHIGATENGDLFSIQKNEYGLDQYAWQSKRHLTKPSSGAASYIQDLHRPFRGKIDSTRVWAYANKYGYSYREAENKLAKRDSYTAQASAQGKSVRRKKSSGSGWWKNYNVKKKGPSI